MISDPEIFYKAYQYDYHNVKATYLKKMLDESSKYGESMFGNNLLEEDINEFRLVLKSDLRQTYFHSIETLFELMFALNPKLGKVCEYYDFTIQFRLTYSNWSETYKKIKEIATDDSALDFFDKEILFGEKNITVGEYFFYMGIFNQAEYEERLKEKIKISIDSIKQGLRIVAREFMKREEYNAYKHGLRIIPSISQISFVPLDDEISPLNFDVSDSMSFYTKMKDPEEIKVITKIFDSDRDYRMTHFCSNLIHQMIFFRRVTMKLDCDKDKFPSIKCPFYSKQSILDFNVTNVKIQDLVFTQTREDKTAGNSRLAQ